MGSLFSIRHCSDALEDFESLARIDSKVYRTMQQQPWTCEQFQAEFQKPYSQILVLSDDETDQILIGYIVFWILEQKVEILNLAVDPEYRAEGFGQKLLRAALKLGAMQQCKKAMLDVRKSNLPAIQLYQKVGFSIARIQKNFYSNGEDALQMSCPLNAE